MSKKFDQSETRPYKSIFKEGYIMPGPYIAELIFKKRAEFFNSGRCPESFWNEPKYQGAYRGQVIQAARLLQKYPADVIINAITGKEGKYILKLQDKKLIPILDKLMKVRKDKVFEESKEEEVKISKPFSTGKNKLGGL